MICPLGTYPSYLSSEVDTGVVSVILLLLDACSYAHAVGNTGSTIVAHSYGSPGRLLLTMVRCSRDGIVAVC